MNSNAHSSEKRYFLMFALTALLYFAGFLGISVTVIIDTFRYTNSRLRVMLGAMGYNVGKGWYTTE